MRTVGIIAEYNPLHEGHLHQLDVVRQYFADCGIIVALSGPFTPRGEPAVLAPEDRAELAIQAGVNLVLQIPYAYSTGAADRFAQGGVELLAGTGICDYFVFGSESGDLTALQETAALLDDEPGAFSTALQSALAEGHSYAAAQAEALATISPEHRALLSGQNNLLAISYLKALRALDSSGKGPEPWTHIRSGDSHLKTATQIRARLGTAEGSPAALIQALAPYLPPMSTAALVRAAREDSLLLPGDLGDPALTRLLTASADALAASPGMGGGLAERLLQVAPDLVETPSEQIWDSLLELTSARHLTRARIGRALNNWLMNFSEEDHAEAKAHGPYAIRVLAFDKRGRYLLRLMREHATLDIINRPSDVLEKQHYEHGAVPADYYRRQARIDRQAERLATRLRQR